MSKPADNGLRPLPIDVVSVQSQVVYGGVGNNAAVPALQAHGLTVAAVPTVALSNTPHYATRYGGAMPIDWFSGYLQGLLDRGALYQLGAVLVGYMGNPQQATVLSDWIDGVQISRPELKVVIDPVIGDYDSGVYVDPRMIETYRAHLLTRAQGLTPNGFELGCLTGLPIDTLEQVTAAARTLLTGRTQWIVVTSAAPATGAADEMRVVLVTRDDVRVVRHARVDATPKGTGDLFSAELTARLLAGTPLLLAVRQACRRVVAAIRHTHAAGCGELMLPPRR